MSLKEIEQIIESIGSIASNFAENLSTDSGVYNKYTKNKNPTGDNVLALDMIANHCFVDGLRSLGGAAAVSSEEEEKAVAFNNNSNYVVCLDPLDGSNNYKTDNQVGLIFGIFKKLNDVISADDHFFQPGSDLIAAGYVLYGHKTVLVSADSFTNTVTSKVINNISIEEIGQKHGPLFSSYQNNIKCPEKGKIVAVNSGNYPHWGKPTKDWFDTIVEYGKSSFRYSGCMVADFHRVLLEGGIFAYPSDIKNLNGKLRLLYECAPLAFIMHMAGGTSTNGDGKTKSILDITPSSLHQTTPVFLGSKQNIEDYFKG